MARGPLASGGPYSNEKRRIFTLLNVVPQDWKLVLVPYAYGRKRPYSDDKVIIRPSEIFERIEKEGYLKVAEESQKLLEELAKQGKKFNVAVCLYKNPYNLVAIDVDEPERFESFLSSFNKSINSVEGYVEKTRRGYHIFLTADIPGSGKLDDLGIEVYGPDAKKMVLISPSVITENGKKIKYEVLKADPLPLQSRPSWLSSIVVRLQKVENEEQGLAPVNRLKDADIESLALEIYEKIKPYYKKGQRQELYLGLGASFAFAGLDEDSALKLAKQIFDLALEDGLEDSLREWDEKRKYAITNTYRRFGEKDTISYPENIPRELWASIKQQIRGALRKEIQSRIEKGIIISFTRKGNEIKPKVVVKLSRSGKSLEIIKYREQRTDIDIIMQGIVSIESYELPEFIYSRIVTGGKVFEGKVDDVVKTLVSQGYVINKNYEQYLKAFLNKIKTPLDAFDYFDGFIVREKDGKIEFPRNADDRIYLPSSDLKALIVEFFRRQVKEDNLFKEFLRKLWELKEFFEQDEPTYYILLGYSLVAPVIDVVSPNFRPALIISGPQQTGKTTMARIFGKLCMFNELNPVIIEGKRPYTRNVLFSLTTLPYYFDDFRKELTSSLKSILTGHEIEITASGTDRFLGFKLRALFMASTNLDPEDITQDPALFERLIIVRKRRFKSLLKRDKFIKFRKELDEMLRKAGYNPETVSFVLKYLEWLAEKYDANALRKLFYKIRYDVARQVNTDERKLDKLALILLGLNIWNRLAEQYLGPEYKYELTAVLDKIIDELDADLVIPKAISTFLDLLSSYARFVKNGIELYIGDFSNPIDFKYTGGPIDVSGVGDNWRNWFLFVPLSIVSEVIQRFRGQAPELDKRRLMDYVIKELEQVGSLKYFDKSKRIFFIKIKQNRSSGFKKIPVLPIPLTWLVYEDKLVTEESEEEENKEEFLRAVRDYKLSQEVQQILKQSSKQEQKETEVSTDLNGVSMDLTSMLNKYVTIELRDGKRVTGRLLDFEPGDSIVLESLGEDHIFKLSEIKSIKVENRDEGS